MLDLAVKEDIVEKSGAWFAYGGAKIGQGRENSKIYLQDNPAVCEEIENKVRARYGLGEDGAAPAGAPAGGAPAGEATPEKRVRELRPNRRNHKSG